MRNQIQAIVLGFIGLLFAGSIPSKIVEALSPEKAPTAQDTVYLTAADQFWMAATKFGAPLVQVAGIGLVIYCVISMLVKASDPVFRHPINSPALVRVVAVILAVLTATFVWISPPKVPLEEFGIGVGSRIERAQDAVIPPPPPTPGQTGWGQTDKTPPPQENPENKTSW